jgi:hypothetical protein
LALVVPVHDGLVAGEVVLDAVGVHEELGRRAPVVAGVEHDPGEILVAEDVVALDELRADVPRARVVAPDRDVEEAVVVRDPGRRLHLRRRVVAGRDLEEVPDLGSPLPAGVVERPVDRDRPRRAGRRDARVSG